MVSRVRVEKSSRHDHTVADQTSNNFPMCVISNGKLDFVNARLSHVKALRIISGRANVLGQHYQQSSFFSVAKSNRLVVRRTWKDARMKSARQRNRGAVFQTLLSVNRQARACYEKQNHRQK